VLISQTVAMRCTSPVGIGGGLFPARQCQSRRAIYPSRDGIEPQRRPVLSLGICAQNDIRVAQPRDRWMHEFDIRPSRRISKGELLLGISGDLTDFASKQIAKGAIDVTRAGNPQRL